MSSQFNYVHHLKIRSTLCFPSYAYELIYDQPIKCIIRHN